MKSENILVSECKSKLQNRSHFQKNTATDRSVHSDLKIICEHRQGTEIRQVKTLAGVIDGGVDYE